MNRAFKYLTILAGGTPQPLVGTYLTAAVTSSMLQPDQTPLLVNVADSSLLKKGDYVTVVDPISFVSERVTIFAIPDATHISVSGLQAPHPGGAAGVGAWIALGAHTQQVYVQALDGNAGALYIGTDPRMVKATGALVIAKVQTVAAGVQPGEFSTTRQGLANTEALSQYWIDGTTGDSYLPSCGVV